MSPDVFRFQTTQTLRYAPPPVDRREVLRYAGCREASAAVAEALDACLAVAPASTLVPGLGTGADDCQLDVSLAATQLALVRSHHLAGLAFFAVDDELLTAILPGLFRK